MVLKLKNEDGLLLTLHSTLSVHVFSHCEECLKAERTRNSIHTNFQNVSHETRGQRTNMSLEGQRNGCLSAGSEIRTFIVCKKGEALVHHPIRFPSYIGSNVK